MVTKNDVRRKRRQTTPLRKPAPVAAAKAVLKPGQRVLVIGAGPSGLVALKTLREHGYNAICAEANETIGGTFHNKTYDIGQLKIHNSIL